MVLNTDYGRPDRKQPSLHSRKFTPTSKFLGPAEAYFVCHIGPTFQISLIYNFIGRPQSVLVGICENTLLEIGENIWNCKQFNFFLLHFSKLQKPTVLYSAHSTYTVLHTFTQLLFRAGNQGNHQNFDLSLLTKKL